MKTLHSTILLSLIISVAVLTQSISAAEPANRQSIQKETLLIHTDRDLYIAGEYLYYQLYLVPPVGTEAPSGIAYMALSGSGNQFIDRVIVRINNNIAYGSIYLPDTLSTGLYSLVCFTSRMRGYHSENYISKPVFIVNRFDETLDKVMDKMGTVDTTATESDHIPPHSKEVSGLIVQTNKSEYRRREKVELSIEMPQGSAEPAFISVSVAAVQSFLFDSRESNGIQREGHNAEHDSSNGFLPETRNVILGGRLRDDAGKGVTDARVLLSTPDSLLNLQYAYTGTNGNFYFPLNNYYLGKSLYLNTDMHDAGLRIEVYDKFHLNEPFNSHAPGFTEEHPDFIFRAQQYVRLQKHYETEFVLMLHAELTGEGFRPLVYGSPNYTIIPGKFTPLRDFPEISRELISQARIRQPRGEYTLRLHDERTAYQFFDETPAIFLDAIPVSNISDIMHLGSEQLQRIEVHNHHWAYGDMRFTGILALFSHKREFHDLSLQPSSLVLPGFVIQTPSVFISPDHEKDAEKLNTLPDLRTLLYWHPAMKIESDRQSALSFFTSDITGTYVIKAEGIDSDGLWISHVTEIIVKQ